MEARLSFGHKTNLKVISLQPNLFKGTSSIRVKTSITSPRLWLQHEPTFQRQATKRLNSRARNSDLESIRPLTTFPPSLWGNRFLDLPDVDSELDSLSREINTLKPKIRDMLMCSDNNSKERIHLIHLLSILGLSYHFENDIEEILKQAFENVEDLIVDEDDLCTISNMFEVFRLYGHKMSFDVFNRFKDDDGNFKRCLGREAKGILSLYEAMHLTTTTEDIMEDALSFTLNHLESLVGVVSPHLSKLIQSAIYQPRYHNMEILVAREYISFYEQEEDHDEMLLKCAKLNFNFLQLQYKQELKILTKWWKDLGIASKLPYTQDRIVEDHLISTAMYFEPQYSAARLIVAKLVRIGVILDDTCDAYGTLPEVATLIDCLQSWDSSVIDKLSDYQKILFKSLLEVLGETERQMRPRERSYSVKETIAQFKTLGRAYLDIAKWARAGYVPTFEEYMEVGLVTAGMDDFAMYSFIGMGEIGGKEAYEWVKSKPKIIQAANAIFRLRNDIATFEKEVSRGEVANGVNCYMKQHGVTKEVAIEELQRMYRANNKILIEEFLNTKVVSRQFLLRILNIARMIDVFYRENDGYTYPEGKLEAHMTALYLDPIPL